MKNVIIVHLLFTYLYSLSCLGEIVAIESFDMDLNLDDRMEKVIIAKNNGLDVLQILSPKNATLFQYELTPLGRDSRIQKITQAKMSSNQQCLLAYYNQGKTGVHGPKNSTRIFSFCFKVSNLRKILVQDLGYVYWDYLAVASFQQLQSLVILNRYLFYSKEKILLTLKGDERKRAWEFSLKDTVWVKLPERRYAEYRVIPTQ
jgi:hypothetical protein